jgi:hypothetical protein
MAGVGNQDRDRSRWPRIVSGEDRLPQPFPSLSKADVPNQGVVDDSAVTQEPHHLLCGEGTPLVTLNRVKPFSACAMCGDGTTFAGLMLRGHFNSVSVPDLLDTTIIHLHPEEAEVTDLGRWRRMAKG